MRLESACFLIAFAAIAAVGVVRPRAALGMLAGCVIGTIFILVGIAVVDSPRAAIGTVARILGMP